MRPDFFLNKHNKLDPSHYLNIFLCLCGVYVLSFVTIWWTMKVVFILNMWNSNIWTLECAVYVLFTTCYGGKCHLSQYTSNTQVYRANKQVMLLCCSLSWSDWDRSSVYFNSLIGDHLKTPDRVKPSALCWSLNVNYSLIIKLASGNGRSDYSQQPSGGRTHQG